MSLKAETAIIDSNILKNLIREKELRVWWIAEQINVDRGTISRWLSGKIKWVKIENLHSLAKILEIDVENLILKSEADLLATPADLQMAANLIKTKNLKSMIRSSENWELLEYVVKSSITPQLPLNLLGSLYLDLSEACFFQNKLKNCQEYIDKCLEIADRLKNQILHWDIIQVQAMIETCHGSLERAAALQLSCIHSNTDLLLEWKSRNNLSIAYFREGSYQKSLDLLNETFEIFKDRKDIRIDEISWCRAYLSRGESQLALGLQKIAQKTFTHAYQLAERIAYSKGMNMSAIQLILSSALLNPNSEQIEKYEEYHSALRLIQDDQLYYEIGAKIYAANGHFQKAEDLLKTALKMSKDFCVEQAMFLDSLTRIQKGSGEKASAEVSYKKAIDLLHKTKAVSRLQQLQDFFEN